MRKRVRLFTHGDKKSGMADPGLTEKGIAEMQSLRPYLLDNPSTTGCGTGNRHNDSASAIGVVPNFRADWIGNADSMEVIGDRKGIVLKDGTMVNPAEYNGLKDMAPTAIANIISSPNDTQLIGGRPDGVMANIMLGTLVDEAVGKLDLESASVYDFLIEEDKIVEVIKIAGAGEVDLTLRYNAKK
ncbi:MAG: hypothetical protein NTY33_03765 [Candidatus Moranbacteria bacterium]|nr:hypothetical protein [Candidatus Moranbacteria bacterium]